jgi:predicted CopG family antitoxin
MKTIALPEETYKELISLKIQENNRSAAVLIDKLVLEYKKKKFLDANTLFRRKLNEKNVGFSNFLKKSARIKGEVSNEWL